MYVPHLQLDTNRVIVHSITNVQLTHANTIQFLIFKNSLKSHYEECLKV